MSSAVFYLKRIQNFSHNAKLWLLQMTIVGLGYSITNVLFPLYLVKLGYQEQFIGSFNSISPVAIGIFALPAALVLSNRPRKAALVIVTALSAGIGVFHVLVPVPSALYISNALFGALQTVFIVCEAPFMMDNSTTEERTYLFSMNFVSMFAMFIVGNAVAGNMPAWISALLGQDPESLVGFRYALLIGMAFRLIAGVPLVFVREIAVTHKPKTDWRMLFAMPSRAVLPKLCLVRIGYAVGCGLFLPFVSVLLKVKLGASTQSIGVISSLTNAGVTIGCLLSPVIERSFGIANGIAVSMLVAAPFMATAGISSVLPIVATALIARETITMATGPLRQRFSMELVTPEERPITASLEQIFWQLPWALGAWLGGRLIPLYGYQVLTIAAAALYVLSGVGYRTMFRREMHEMTEMAGAKDAGVPEMD